MSAGLEENFQCAPSSLSAVQWVPHLSSGCKAVGAWRWPSTHI